MGTTWGPWGCGDHIGTIWRQHGDNLRTMWRQHGDNMRTMGMCRPCGDNVETIWGQHGDHGDVVKVAEFPKLTLKHGILLNLPI